MTGSFNFSTQARTKNYENFVIIKDKKAISMITEIFDKDYEDIKFWIEYPEL